MEKCEIIDIALASDSGYFCGLFVTACSIAKYAAKSASLRFNILDGGIAEADWKLLEDKVRTYHPKSEFNRIPVNDGLFKDYPAWHGNKMAYARLMLPDILPEVDWCIYCDVDFLWMRDIAELWAERDESCAFIGTKDGSKWALDMEEAWFLKHGFPFDREKYFCSGLSFMNLKYFRNEGLIEKCKAILTNYPDIQFPDQAALNIVVWGSLKLVPQCWQRIHQYVTPEMIAEGAVVHYAGAIPWKPIKNKVGLLSDLTLLWHRMNAEARGISVWDSLRKYFGIGYILWHRGLRNVLYVLNRIKCLAPLRWILVKVGHAGVWEYWIRSMAKI